MQAQPGNRMVQGDSGVVFEVPESVASGLVGNKTVVYVDDDDQAVEQKSRSRSGKGRQASKAEKQAAADDNEAGAGDEDGVDESAPDDAADSHAVGEDRDPAAAARRARRTRGRTSASE